MSVSIYLVCVLVCLLLLLFSLPIIRIAVIVSIISKGMRGREGGSGGKMTFWPEILCFMYVVSQKQFPPRDDCTVTRKLGSGSFVVTNIILV